MAGARKPAETRIAPERPGSGGQPIENGPVEVRQGLPDMHVLYVLIASLVLIFVAYILIGIFFVR